MLLNRLTQQEKQNLITDYTNKVEISTLSKRFAYTPESIRQYLKSQNIYLRPLRKYFCDESYFEKIDTEPKAYFLGLFYADLHVASSPSNQPISIKMEHAAHDTHIVEEFKKHIKSEHRITITPSKKKTQQDSCKLCVYSTKIAKDLTKLGCTPRKSLTITFPSTDIVPEHLMRHFIRGVFDGDGGVSLSYGARLSGCNVKYNIKFTGTLSIMQGIRDYLVKDIELSYKAISKRKECNAYTLQFAAKTDVIRFYHYIYLDATVFLFRKELKLRDALTSVMLRRPRVSKYKYICYDKHNKKHWYIAKRINGIKVYFGSFYTEEEAYQSLLELEKNNYSPHQAPG